MAEPHSTAATGSALLVALATSSVSPIIDPWAALLIGAVGGGFLAATEVATKTFASAAIAALRGIVMALLFGGLAALWAEPYIKGTNTLLLIAAAGVIAWKQLAVVEMVRGLRGPKE